VGAASGPGVLIAAWSVVLKGRAGRLHGRRRPRPHLNYLRSEVRRPLYATILDALFTRTSEES